MFRFEAPGCTWQFWRRCEPSVNTTTLQLLRIIAWGPCRPSKMSMNVLRLWFPTRCSVRVHQCARAGSARRKYATHHNMDFGGKSKLLSELESKQRSSDAKHDTVGPFQLGLSQSALRKGEKPRKWSELSTSGKGTSCELIFAEPLLILATAPSEPQSCVRLPVHRI